MNIILEKAKKIVADDIGEPNGFDFQLEAEIDTGNINAIPILLDMLSLEIVKLMEEAEI